MGQQYYIQKALQTFSFCKGTLTKKTWIVWSYLSVTKKSNYQKNKYWKRNLDY